MTLRKVLTNFSGGMNRAKFAEKEAMHIICSAPRGQWREASARKAEEAAQLRVSANLADALLLTLEDSVLDRELTPAQQLFFAQNPELAFA